MQLFDNRLDLVLAAYNAGENAVLRYGQRIPPYREETQLYACRGACQMPRMAAAAAAGRGRHRTASNIWRAPASIKSSWKERNRLRSPPPRYSF